MKVDFGLDAPAIAKGSLAAGLAIFVAGLVLPMTRFLNISHRGSLAITIMALGLAVLGQGAYMVWCSSVGKIRARDRLLNELGLSGQELLLDVGCGHGLMLLGAAERLPHGRATGLDLWSQKDQGDNSRENTLRNAKILGLEGRVQVVDGDMCKMPFAAASFDVVTASLAIHNVPTREGRRQALSEIKRVLRPKGRLLILDIFVTKEYVEDLQALGFANVTHSAPVKEVFYARVVRARKDV